jgi:hypothetical protein
MSFTQRNLCLGCIQNQPNQLAHMDLGGCLYTADDEEVWETDSSEACDSDADDDADSDAVADADAVASLEPLNLEQAFSEAEGEAGVEAPKIDVSKPLVEPLFALPCGFQFPECAICYEQIEMVNVTVTTCGHAFHSSCAFKALENNDCCPMCRHQLLDAPAEDDESEGEYEESVDEEGEDGSVADSDSDEDAKVNLEQLAGKLTNMGYTMQDILKFFVSDVKSGTNEQKYSEEFIDKMEQDINGVIEGTISLAHRDARSYAAVAAAPKPQQAAPAQVEVEAPVVV